MRARQCYCGDRPTRQPDSVRRTEGRIRRAEARQAPNPYLSNALEICVIDNTAIYTIGFWSKVI